MRLFLTLLPLYLLGNLHCAGMCGPLAFLIGKHKYRYLYFVGRIVSFTLAGLLCAEMGSVVFHHRGISALLASLFGLFLIFLGCCHLLRWRLPGNRWLMQKTAGLSTKLATLMQNDHPQATFLFGLFTILLPCGQTMVVFSACALEGSPLTGTANGFLFALLTSPSLLFAMHATHFLGRLKRHLPLAMGLTTLCVGLLATLRGLADFGTIPHCILNSSAPSHYHIVLF